MNHDLHKVSQARRLCFNGQGRSLRTRAQVSVRELADAVGVDPATLSRWENGVTFPRAGAAIRWIDVLEVLTRPLDNETT